MPTGNEETETGEKFEDNALPWDSIDAATYVKSGDLTAFGPELLKEHNARIAKDPEFQNIMKDIARFNAMKDKRNIVSLNYAVREKENNEDDATRLARLNERFKREGKPELKKLDDLPRIAKDPEFQNIMKDIARFNAMKDKRNIVSLNYAVREKENNEDDATRRARLNERFKREGKPELKKLDDLPKDYQEPDPYLDETVNIALDLAKLEKARPAEQPAPVK